MKKFFPLFLSFVILNITINANVEKYLKKCEGKETYHNMRNIDFIYMINLDERPEKFENSYKQLQPYGIYPYRFSAINGWKLPLEIINDVGVKYTKRMRGSFWGTYYPVEKKGQPVHEIIHYPMRTYFCHCMSRGAVAIVLSHLSILQDAYNSGYERIWVMEDDIDIIRNPNIISDIIDELNNSLGKNNWDILFTDRDTKNKFNQYIPCTGYALRPNFSPKDRKRFSRTKKISKNTRQIGARYGAYSYIINRSGMRKILNFIKKYQIFLPYDMDFYLEPSIKIFTVIEDVVSTRINAESDNGGPNYLKK